MKFLVLVNFKAYEKGVGKKGVKLAKAIGGFKSRYQLAVCPQLVDLKEICKLRVKVFAQHVDAIEVGSHTGAVLARGVKEAGAVGSLINHSERRLSLSGIKERVEVCKRLGLKSVVCAGSLGVIKKVIKFRPDYVAYEPKRWIGKNVSVTSMNPKVIVKAVKLCGKKLLVGAGVHSRKDILKAEELGAVGVLVAHKIVQAKDVKKVLKGLLETENYL